MEPLNHRKIWSNEEYKKLYLEVKNKINIEQIAKNHERSIGAIKYKLYKYAIRLSKEHNLNLGELSMITNLTEEEILYGFSKFNYTIPQKPAIVTNNNNNLYICVAFYYAIMGIVGVYCYCHYYNDIFVSS